MCEREVRLEWESGSYMYTMWLPAGRGVCWIESMERSDTDGWPWPVPHWDTPAGVHRARALHNSQSPDPDIQFQPIDAIEL
jgi:hypothetical protein